MPPFIKCQSLECILALTSRLALPHEPTNFSPCLEAEAKVAAFKIELGTPAHAKRETYKGSP